MNGERERTMGAGGTDGAGWRAEIELAERGVDALVACKRPWADDGPAQARTDQTVTDRPDTRARTHARTYARPCARRTRRSC
jgi:hypothetical protein